MVDLEDCAYVILSMRELLEADTWEEQKARAILEFERAVFWGNEELSLAVWDLLRDEPRTRNAWKRYVEQASHTRRECDRL
jgi:hypothetical protein